LLLFPVNLPSQRIYKDAPFDVTASKLSNTFFTTWDSIKNNIILHWIDVTDKAGQYGMALFTDHTTAYTHGEDHPLGLVVQYAGKGLWGRNYAINGPTTIHYAILPHAGTWDREDLEAARTRLAEPLQASMINTPSSSAAKSLIHLDKKGWALSALIIEGNDLLVRLYNAAGADSTVNLYLQASAEQVTIEELNSATKMVLTAKQSITGETIVAVTAPRFGIRTIRFRNVVH
jgi:alpha-mannosidase